MSQLTDLSVVQAVSALRSGEISSVMLTRAYLDRMTQLEPHIHAYITPTPQLALEMAQKADDQLIEWRKNPQNVLPALCGLPIAVKDVLCTKGIRTTCGSKILENYIPPFNATAVERLFKAGVVMLGKTNTDEFAMGSSTENSAYGATHNPWHLAHVPGGSSGGSAAAVAAHLAPAAFGTDTGGSVRQPCSFCGLTGIKPTYGRVSRYGLIAYGSSLDCVGMMAHSAADVALLLQEMAGVDAKDSTSVNCPMPEIQLLAGQGLQGLTIGVPEEYFIKGIQPEVETAVHHAVAQLAALGATVVPVSLPHTAYALPVYYLIAPAEASANLARYDGIRFGLHVQDDDLTRMYCKTRGAGFGQEVKRRIMLGTYALSAGYYDAYYGQAQKVRTLIKQDFDRVFETVDVICGTVVPNSGF